MIYKHHKISKGANGKFFIYGSKGRMITGSLSDAKKWIDSGKKKKKNPNFRAISEMKKTGGKFKHRGVTYSDTKYDLGERPKKRVLNPGGKKISAMTFEDVLSQIKKAKAGARHVKLPDGKQFLMDSGTANLLLQVYDNISDKAKFQRMAVTSGGLLKLVDFAWKHGGYKNPGRRVNYSRIKKTRTPEKQFLDFTGRQRATITTLPIDIPGPHDKLINIGDAPELVYKSPKWDGILRVYVHDLKKHGKILALPRGERVRTIIITGLDLRIKKEGLTG